MKGMMRFAGALIVVSSFLFACGGEEAEAPDATVEQPDATPVPVYPSGPYGFGAGDIMANEQWQAFVDGDDAGNDPFDEAPRTWKLEEYWTGTDPEAKIIMITASAGWCYWCQVEAQGSAEFRAGYAGTGARFITAVFQDESGAPADANYTKLWGQTYDYTAPTLIDTDFILGNYLDVDSMPMNMFVLSPNMEIIAVTVGYDEMAFKNILDYYLAQ
jgi:hypothetical protein